VDVSEEYLRCTATLSGIKREWYVINISVFSELRQEIAVWKRAAASLSSYSRDEDLVRRTLEKKVNSLTLKIQPYTHHCHHP
jgi:hypothetical protein